MPGGADNCQITPDPALEISEADVLEAMKGLPGYLDITPGDFRQVYRLAHERALKRLGLSLTARELMTSPAVSVSQDMLLPQVAQVMARAGVSGAPVLDGQGRVAGVISEKDFLRLMDPQGLGGFMGVVATCMAGGACLVAPFLEQPVGQVMSRPALTVGPETTLAAMAGIMAQSCINRLPVVDGQGALLGMVTRSDLLRRGPGRRS